MIMDKDSIPSGGKQLACYTTSPLVIVLYIMERSLLGFQNEDNLILKYIGPQC